MSSTMFAKIRLTSYGLRKLSSKLGARQVHLTASRTHKYIPRRAVMYVPGNDERKLSKIESLKADCIVLDCEDGVAISKKDVARNVIQNYLQKEKVFKGKDCSVRFNSVDSGLCEKDIEVILSSPILPATIHLPKVETYGHIEWFADKIKATLNERKLEEPLRLIIFMESALSLLNFPSLCQRTLQNTGSAPFILDGIVFGSDDFCADIGATRTGSANEVFYARQQVVTIAKAFNLQAIDLVHINYKDLDDLKRQSEEGAQFGFTGKQVIHPNQVETVLNAFTPSLEKIEWAEKLVNAFKLHQKEGKGAFTFQDNMIDMPLLRQAQNILQMARHSS